MSKIRGCWVGMVALVAMISIADAAWAQDSARERSPLVRVADDGQLRERMRAEREARGRSLSPEERRDIRRDITQHGREVYGDRPGGQRSPGPNPQGPRGGKARQ